MSTILILFIIIGLTLYGLQEYYQIRLGIRPRRTPPSVVSYLTLMLQDLSENGSFLDLGSGYGTTVFGLAKQLPGWELTGVEKSPTPWILANLMSAAKNYGNYRFLLDDATVVSLHNYTVIFADQNVTLMKRWEAGLARRLNMGTLLVSLNAPLPRVRAFNKVTIDEANTLYFYQKAEQQAAPTPQQQAQPAPPAAPPQMPQNEQPTEYPAGSMPPSGSSS